MKKKIRIIRRVQPASSDVDTAAPARRLIPIKQAGYIVLSFGLLVASAMLFFVEPELAQPFFDQPFNIYRVVIMALAVISSTTPCFHQWLAKG